MTSPAGENCLSALLAPVSVLKHVGPKTLHLLSRLLSCSALVPARVLDLLFHLPHGVIDRRNVTTVEAARPGEIATLTLTVGAHAFPRVGASRSPFRVRCYDDTGECAVVYFAADARQLKRQFALGAQVRVSGRVDEFNGVKQIAHPDYAVPLTEAAKIPALEPLYTLTEGLHLKTLQTLMRQACARLTALPEWLPPSPAIAAWPGFAEALQRLHNPTNLGDVDVQSVCRQRLAVDELFSHQLVLQLARQNLQYSAAPVLAEAATTQAALQPHLPYTLTPSQGAAWRDLARDMAQPKPMHRLLQGDVGSGKTIVAFLAMACAARSGCQSVLMAPTDILARQHYATLNPLAEKLGMRAALLTGSDKGAPRAAVLNAVQGGEVQMLIGTHAVFQDSVSFHALALAVVDEQHRFGVAQRLALSQKGSGVHRLIMTATPIPRTLVLACYGDMDVSCLTEKPPGRMDIITRVIPLARVEEVMDALARLVESGQRAYWVCPLIEESPAAPFATVEARYAALKERFGARVGLLHGRLSSAAKQKVMTDFVAGVTQILVATTVIEVGVHVAQATLMVVEQAERFGLAQLHQLRGRVGRGAASSSCVLLYDPQRSSALARERLQVMRDTQDGFRIADADLRLRGPGDVLGLRQSGLPPSRCVDWAAHAHLIPLARDMARAVLAGNPHLAGSHGQAVHVLQRLFARRAAADAVLAG